MAHEGASGLVEGASRKGFSQEILTSYSHELLSEVTLISDYSKWLRQVTIII